MPSQSWKPQLKRLATAVLIKLICISWVWFERNLQKWRHKFVFFNSFRCTLGRRLIFHTHITFNQYYCFTKFQCDDVILVHFTDQNSFQGLWSVKSVSFNNSKKRITQVWDFIFFATPWSFKLKKLITAVTMSLCVFLTFNLTRKQRFWRWL